MMDSQTLLADYARNGSEAAFRELVARYCGLVYSAALRVTGGDTHLAEDVVQTVFTDLARKAGGLPGTVMLGGWLHQRAFNVAAPMMRARRRREFREREAVNAPKDDSDADFNAIIPILDDAITRLGAADRAAIILRFFERVDFQSIGDALGQNEDAARMRVNRALDKLRRVLTRRGVTLSAAALGAALAGNTLTAAPVGLPASVAGSVLAATGGGGIAAGLVKITIMTKLKAGIVTAVILGGLTASLIVWREARVNQHVQDESLRRQAEQLARITEENQRLAGLVPGPDESKEQLAALARLRGEAESLRPQTNTLAALREDNLRLRRESPAKTLTPLQAQEEQGARLHFEKNWLVAFRIYAGENGDQYPGGFAQAEEFLPSESKTQVKFGADDYEIVYHGSTAVPDAGQVILLRETEPWLNTLGEPCRDYGMADGSVQIVKPPITWSDGTVYETFEAFERDHIRAPAAK